MNNNQTYKQFPNLPNCVYHKASQCWFQMPEDEYKKYMNECSRIRKKEQYHKRCRVTPNKFFLCDGMCDDCGFHKKTGMLSLDYSASVEFGTLLDEIESPCPSPEKIVEDQDELNYIIWKLKEIEPNIKDCLRIWLEEGKVSDREMARRLGIPHRTFADHMTRVRKQLRELLDE